MTDFFINKNENRFLISNRTTLFSYSEHECVEILVSLLRVFCEYKVFHEKDNYIHTKLIMDKPDYGFTAIISDNRLNVSINDCCLFQYGFEEIKDTENYIYDFLNNEYGMNRIDFRWFDPFYLEHMLGVDLPYIIGVEFSHENIENLYFYNRVEPKKARIFEHQVYKNLVMGTSSDSEAERINNILSGMTKNSLSKERFYGVVYNEEMVIRDGTHRIACLYYLYGNISIPIIIIKTSKEYYSYSMYKASVNSQYKEVIK